MILVIKKGEGAYDDYHEWIDSIWSIRKKKFNLEIAWQAHLLKAYNDAGIPVTMNKHRVFDFSALNKGQFNQLRKIYSSMDMHKFLKEVVKAKQLNFQDITI